MTYTGRVKLATFLLLAIALYTTGVPLHRLSQLLAERKGGPDEIAYHRMRCSGLKPYLPLNTTIGYISETPPVVRDFYILRYVLSPVRLVQNSDHHLVVGNFRRPESAGHIARKKDLAVVRNFGNGVVLFTRKRN